MRVIFFGGSGEQKSYIKKSLKNVEFSPEPLTAKNASRFGKIEAIVVFVHSEITKEVLEKMPKLRFIATSSTGYDHIDIFECKKRGIAVSNVPNYGVNTVAEYAFGLILSLSRKIPKASERTKKRDFSLSGLKGFDLKDKTLGLIGVGHIGSNVAKIAEGFGMKVIGVCRKKKPGLNKYGFRKVDLDYLLRNSDVISMHLPFNKETEHMINMKNVRKIKRGAYLVNTARGEIIETKALLYALEKDILAGAALDVLEEEEDIFDETEILTKSRIPKKELKKFMQNNKILRDKDVLVTPHSAFYTKEALQRILDTSIGNVKAFKKGKVLNKVV